MSINAYLFVWCLGAQLAQSHWNVFVCTRTYAAKAHRAFPVVLPERALLVQIGFVKSKVVLDQEAAQTRVDFVVVEVVDGVHGTAAIMNGAFQLFE